LFAGADWFSLIGIQPDRSNALPSCAWDHSSSWITLPCAFVDSGVSGQDSLVGMRMSLSRCDETERTVAMFVVVTRIISISGLLQGAKPYYLAFDRSVKLIGPTAHYLTENHDEGQSSSRASVDHRTASNERTAIGRDMQCVTLARPVRWHVEHRIMLSGCKTNSV
jgi:hypothetical protein